MKHHRCEVNHPKTTPKKFKRCLPPQRASDRNSVGPSAGHRTAGLGAPGSLQNLIVRHHFSPSKRFKEASNRQKVLTHSFFHEFFTHEKNTKNQELPTWFCTCNCATIGGGPREFPASVSSMCRSWRGEQISILFPDFDGFSLYRKIMKNMGLYKSIQEIRWNLFLNYSICH